MKGEILIHYRQGTKQNRTRDLRPSRTRSLTFSPSALQGFGRKFFEMVGCWFLEFHNDCPAMIEALGPGWACFSHLIAHNFRVTNPSPVMFRSVFMKY